MAQIKDERQYQIILKRVEALMDIVTEETPLDDPNSVELDLLADLAEEYEMEHYPIAVPALNDALKTRMNELGLTQKSLAELLEISAPRVSEYLTGKTEPTLQVARRMHRKLNIAASILL
jgi:HTH-type transcriptional regulator/antitoxin HigA